MTKEINEVTFLAPAVTAVAGAAGRFIAGQVVKRFAGRAATKAATRAAGNTSKLRKAAGVGGAAAAGAAIVGGSGGSGSANNGQSNDSSELVSSTPGQTVDVHIHQAKNRRPDIKVVKEEQKKKELTIIDVKPKLKKIDKDGQVKEERLTELNIDGKRESSNIIDIRGKEEDYSSGKERKSLNVIIQKEKSNKYPKLDKADKLKKEQK